MVPCLLQRPTRFQSTGHHQPPGCARVETVVLTVDYPFGTDRHRHIKRTPYLEPIESRRSDADDLERIVSQCQFATDDIPVAAIFTLPESIADNRARRAATTCVIARCEDPAENR